MLQVKLFSANSAKRNNNAVVEQPEGTTNQVRLQCSSCGTNVTSKSFNSKNAINNDSNKSRTTFLFLFVLQWFDGTVSFLPICGKQLFHFLKKMDNRLNSEALILNNWRNCRDMICAWGGKGDSMTLIRIKTTNLRPLKHNS